MAATSLRISSSNGTITVNKAGTNVDFGVNGAANGGLYISSGLLVRGFRTVSSDPGSFSAGDNWFNTTLQIPKVATTSTFASPITQTIISGSNGNIITNTTTQTQMTPKVTLPAGFLNQANIRVIRITAILGGTGLAGSSFTLSLCYNGTGNVIWTHTFSGTAMQNSFVELLLSTTAAGASGQILTIGKIFNSAISYTSVNGFTTLDLTAGGDLSFYGQWGTASASNSANLAIMIAELVA